MDKITLQQRIALWKSLPSSGVYNETDTFVDALISRIDELEHELEDVAFELVESRN